MKRVMWWPTEPDDTPRYPAGFVLLEVNRALFSFAGDVYEFERITQEVP